MVNTSVVVGIHIDTATVNDLVDDTDVVCWKSQHESLQQPLLQLWLYDIIFYLYD